MGLSIVAVFLYAGTMSTSEIVAAQADGNTFELLRRHLHRPRAGIAVLLPVSFVIYVDRRGRRDQPGALRPAGGRERAGRRLPHRVLVAEVRAVLPGRVHQHGHRLGAGRDAVPRRLAGAVADLDLWDGANTGWWPMLWFFLKVVVGCSVHLAARHAAPAALRPVHAVRLEGAGADRAGAGSSRSARSACCAARAARVGELAAGRRAWSAWLAVLDRGAVRRARGRGRRGRPTRKRTRPGRPAPAGGRAGDGRTGGFPIPPMDLMVPPSPRLRAREPVTVPSAPTGGGSDSETDPTGETR